jgi:hypothetical protein
MSFTNGNAITGQVDTGLAKQAAMDAELYGSRRNEIGVNEEEEVRCRLSSKHASHRFSDPFGSFLTAL